GLAAGDERRVRGLRGGGRLRRARLVALRRLGHGARRGLAGAALLGARARRLAGLHAGRPAPAPARLSGVSRELLRGRRVRALGRRAPADRGRVGDGGGRAARGRLLRRGRRARARAARARRGPHGAGAPVRRRVGVDREPLRRVSGLSPGGGRARRVHRQGHGEPDGVARRLVRVAARPPARELPQLLPARGALAVERRAARAGRRMSLSQTSPDAGALSAELRDRAPDAARMRDEVWAGLGAPRKTLPCKWLYDARGSALFERICELPEYYPTRTELGILEAHAGEMADR